MEVKMGNWEMFFCCCCCSCISMQIKWADDDPCETAVHTTTANK